MKDTISIEVIVRSLKGFANYNHKSKMIRTEKIISSDRIQREDSGYIKYAITSDDLQVIRIPGRETITLDKIFEKNMLPVYCVGEKGNHNCSVKLFREQEYLLGLFRENNANTLVDLTTTGTRGKLCISLENDIIFASYIKRSNTLNLSSTMFLVYPTRPLS